MPLDPAAADRAERGTPVAPLIDREAALEQAATSTLDVLVIGGGITGAGIALDAVSRGLKAALVERADLASGTSSKSSKLVHGGLRYLEQRELGLVHEAVRERNLLRRIAPHLVRPLAFAIPTATRARRMAVKAGLTVYDGLATGRNVRTHQRLDRAALVRSVPGLTHGIDGGGYRYYDCQTDDARLTLAVAQTARRLGALVCNHAEVVELLRFDQQVVGATVRDRLSGTTVETTAAWVVNATGVWADLLRGLTRERPQPLLTPSKGVHLTFSARDVQVRDAAFIPSGADDGRLVFVIPWGEQVIVGTTDDRYDGALDAPSLTAPDAGYLLHAVNSSFGTNLGIQDALGAWAGLRPLLRGKRQRAASRDLSRRHAVFEEPPGLITVTGGKLTTYRSMAREVVDRIVAARGGRAACVTDRLPIGPREGVEEALSGLRELCRIVGIDPEMAGSLLHRHGAEAAAVAAFCVDQGEADRLVADLPYLRGEVRWAVRYELARTLDDVLQRRLRVSLRSRDAGGEAAAWTARALAEEFGWSDEERDRQLGVYLDAVAHERGVVALDRSWQATGAVRS